MFYIGIDPGLSGAIAVLDNDGAIRKIDDMPVSTKGSGKKQVDPYELVRILGVAKSLGQTKAYVELVNAMPGQGVSSMFNFGEGCGVVRGVLAAIGIPVEYVHPAKWKRHLNLSGKDKDYARTVAAETVLGASPYVCRKKDIGRADAILIATYGFNTNY
jgi:crossover junction endodeoxyribonuclease RuvC